MPPTMASLAIGPLRAPTTAFARSSFGAYGYRASISFMEAGRGVNRG